MNFLLTTAASASGGTMGWGFIIGYIVLIGALMYFMAIRPQKKQQKKQQELMNSVETGDSILTTSGFYGVVIDITDDNLTPEIHSVSYDYKEIMNTMKNLNFPEKLIKSYELGKE